MLYVVLLSGGLDSAVNLQCALDDGEVVAAVTFDYGQAAAANEMRAAGEYAARSGVSHKIIDLDGYWGLLPESMRDSDRVAAHRDLSEADPGTMLREAWVPNRNGVFVNIAAAFAEAHGAGAVVLGLNREEAEIFPDNSDRFLEDTNRALAVSTLTGVRAFSFTTRLSKREIVQEAIARGVDLDLVYSCYRGSADHRMCGECQSCVRLRTALAAEDYNGLNARFAK